MLLRPGGKARQTGPPDARHNRRQPGTGELEDRQRPQQERELANCAKSLLGIGAPALRTAPPAKRKRKTKTAPNDSYLTLTPEEQKERPRTASAVVMERIRREKSAAGKRASLSEGIRSRRADRRREGRCRRERDSGRERSSSRERESKELGKRQERQAHEDKMRQPGGEADAGNRPGKVEADEVETGRRGRPRRS